MVSARSLFHCNASDHGICGRRDSVSSVPRWFKLLLGVLRGVVASVQIEGVTLTRDHNPG